VISVAIIGPDGAGKSTISELLEQRPMPAPVKRIYMGVNLEASSMMLPTTRLALAVKAARGRRPDMAAPSPVAGGHSGSPARRVMRGGARAARLLLWVAEEWFRQAVASYHRRRGSIVVFDRHFYADYYHFDVASDGSRPTASRVHGFLLEHLYPRPDLVICLDAPGQVLFDRKREASPDWLEHRRRQYRELAAELPDFVVVDADRPLEAVTSDVADVITDYYRKRCA
jgi:thymidylate kinase